MIIKTLSTWVEVVGIPSLCLAISNRKGNSALLPFQNSKGLKLVILVTKQFISQYRSISFLSLLLGAFYFINIFYKNLLLVASAWRYCSSSSLSIIIDLTMFLSVEKIFNSLFNFFRNSSFLVFVRKHKLLNLMSKKEASIRSSLLLHYRIFRSAFICLTILLKFGYLSSSKYLVTHL